MYRNIKETEQIYVLRSADKTITKIGRSTNVDTRTDTICIAERKKYYLVYQSQPLLRADAQILENEIIKQFNNDCIKGKEWLSTHPLTVIKFIVEKIGRQKKDDIYLSDLAKHEVYLVKNSVYNNITYTHLNGVRIGVNYYAYVRTIYNGQFITLGFSNINDAYEFVRLNKHLQNVVDKITDLLFDKPYNEWVIDNQSKGTNEYNWLLL